MTFETDSKNVAFDRNKNLIAIPGMPNIRYDGIDLHPFPYISFNQFGGLDRNMIFKKFA